MTKNSKKGFTIIEVVLVLAIAGLIFLMVFIALPALQRSQRNTQRRQDVSRFVSAVTQYKSNNKNKLPWNTAQNGIDSNFVARYIGAAGSDQVSDPDGSAYVFSIATGTDDANAFATTETFDSHAVKIFAGVMCSDTENVMKKAGGTANFAVFYMLEGGSITCSDDQ